MIHELPSEFGNNLLCFFFSGTHEMFLLERKFSELPSDFGNENMNMIMCIYFSAHHYSYF